MVYPVAVVVGPGGGSRCLLVECDRMNWPLRFGIFLAPFHPVGQNPTLALERDLELVVRLDELGFDEAWFGEHHSAGYEIIASPEVFIGVVSQRTRNIRLGTGVSSLPYHHPFILADRMVLLDHLTRGRVMFGVGPGALPSDAFMMGIDPMSQRDMMEESLEAILALLDGSEPVTRADVVVHPARRPTAAPALYAPPFRGGGGRADLPRRPPGGWALRAVAAVDRRHLGGWLRRPRVALAGHGGAGRRVRHRGRSAQMAAGRSHAHRRDRGAGPGRGGVRPGPVGGLLRACGRLCPLAPGTLDPDKMVDALMETGFAVVGTPAMAIAQIERLVTQSGGFGTYLLMAHEWADRQATLRSYELFAREVVPHFQGTLASLEGSRDWAAENRPEFIGAVGGAIMQAITDHHAERDAKQEQVQTTET